MSFWLNGEFSTTSDAISIADRGFLLGDGLFETILVVNGVPAFFDAHIDRMEAAQAALQLGARVDESILAVILELVARNKLVQGLSAVRITISRGSGARGLLIPGDEPAKPTVLATVSKYHAPNDLPPIKLTVSSFKRSEASLTSRHKTLNYLDNIMARNEAVAQGCDDAVMLNSAGRAACVSAGNIFQYAGAGAAVTPALSEGALGGIVRGILLGAAGSGLAIDEGAIECDSLLNGGLFITNSLLGVRPAVMTSASALLPAGADNFLHRVQSWYERVLEDDLRRRAEKI